MADRKPLMPYVISMFIAAMLLVVLVAVPSCRKPPNTTPLVARITSSHKVHGTPSPMFVFVDLGVVPNDPNTAAIFSCKGEDIKIVGFVLVADATPAGEMPGAVQVRCTPYYVIPDAELPATGSPLTTQPLLVRRGEAISTLDPLQYVAPESAEIGVFSECSSFEFRLAEPVGGSNPWLRVMALVAPK